MGSGSVMAFDFGTKSIGIAVGQRITCTAQPLISLKAIDGVPNWQKLSQIIHEWQPDALVVGLPLNMDDSEQLLTTQARKFANYLYKFFGIKVILHDERLSTIIARAILFERGGYHALQKKGQIDAESAVLILESWLRSFKGALLDLTFDST